MDEMFHTLYRIISSYLIAIIKHEKSFTENAVVALHLHRKNLNQNRQGKNGEEKKVAKRGGMESESKSTVVNLGLMLAQKTPNLLRRELENRQDLQRIYNYPQTWQLLLVQVKLLDTRL